MDSAGKPHFKLNDKRDLIGHILEHRYEVEDLIGEGAMGYVYRGRQIRLKRPVAIKVPRPEFTANTEFMARFEREALAMAKCVHENIVTIFDVYVSRTPGEISYIAMELVEGPELDDFLRDHASNFKVRDVLSILAQLARGIDAAHGAGVVHRDIKPSNIVVTQPKRIPKIMDFGIARGRLDHSLLTQTDVTIGTPAYMAPELIRGEEAGPPADVYSFAQTIYYLFARAQPYTGTSTVALMYAKVHKVPTPLREHNSRWPLELDEALMRGLHKQPDKRPPSACELMSEIERSLAEILDYPFGHFFIDSSSAQTVQIALPEPKQPLSPRRALMTGIAGLALVAMLAVSIWALGGLLFPGERQTEMAHVPAPAISAAIIDNHPEIDVNADPDLPVIETLPPTIAPSILPQAPEEPGTGIGESAALPESKTARDAPSQEELADSQVALDQPDTAPSPGLDKHPAQLAEDIEEIIVENSTSESSSSALTPSSQERIAIAETAAILDGTYDWKDEVYGAGRELELRLIDEVFLAKVRQSIFRAELEQLEGALADVDTESRLRFLAMIEALQRTHRQIKFVYTREAAKIDPRFAIVQIETGLTGQRRSVNNAEDEVLIPRFRTRVVLMKSGREWALVTWPHFTNPQ